MRLGASSEITILNLKKRGKSLSFLPLILISIDFFDTSSLSLGITISKTPLSLFCFYIFNIYIIWKWKLLENLPKYVSIL